MKSRTDTPASLTLAWLALVGLTFASLAMGQWSASSLWSPLLMAAIIWAKCAIIADRFIESNQARPFIRRLVQAFIAFAPIALILVTIFGSEIGRWTALD